MERSSGIFKKDVAILLKNMYNRAKNKYVV
jgi:hypothetical protein